MINCITNQKLERQIEHIIQYLPNPEELEGQRGGSSYYRKVNEESFIREFKKTHRNLSGLKKKYTLTEEQCSILSESQAKLVHDVEEAFAKKAVVPANLGDFISHYKAS